MCTKNYGQMMYGSCGKKKQKNTQNPLIILDG